MDLLRNMNEFDRQKYDWGEISWLHEPIESPQRRLSAARVKVYSGCRQEKHFHLGEEQLFYVVQGHGSFITDGKKEDVHESMIVYCPPYSEHEVYNTGDGDLIFIIVYVPIKLIQPEKPYTFAMDKNLKDLVPPEILENIKEQLSELLKLTIHICDGSRKPLTNEDESNDFCKLCSKIQGCSKAKYSRDSTNQLFDRIYKCEYELMELETPITLNENILGYIKSSLFTLKSSDELEDKIGAVSRSLEGLGIKPDVVFNSYQNIPNIIKSRIYVIDDCLSIAAKFLQEILERSIFENELLEKDNEILVSTKEKMQLKAALKKANNKIYNDKIFTGGFGLRKEIPYPFELEILLEDSIKDMDREKIEENIMNYKSRYSEGKNIVQEMIIVLSRTALRKLENIEIISSIRNKYDRYLGQASIENPWDILQDFCFECIDEYEKVLQANRGELIDNINMYIKLHYRENLSLSQIADEFYISPNYLSSLFNEKNHISLSDYIQNLRIEDAKTYLRTTKMKVSDIGKKVGCRNNSYFVNIFKKNVGLTPNEYRKNSQVAEVY